MLKCLVFIAAFYAVAVKTDEFRSSGQHVNGFYNVEQRVDHFNPHNRNTFKQRYYAKGDFYTHGGPIYIVVNGQEDVNEYALNYALIAQIANETNGLIYSLEHRYYGYSFPTTDISTDNLRFLTVDQSLSDLAHFIAHIKNSTPNPDHQNSAIILAGRGYGGSLAIWFRQKYPHLAQGAWASSAPMLAKPNHFEYKELVAEAARQRAGPNCYAAIDATVRHLAELATAGNLNELPLFNYVCGDHPVNGDNEVSMLFLEISDFLQIMSTYQGYIPEFCSHMENASIELPLERFLNYLDVRGFNCFPVDYDKLVAHLSRIDLVREEFHTDRQELYQQCSELGGFQTSDGANHPFSSLFPLSYFTTLCGDIFGTAFSEAALNESSRRFNVQHGGLLPQVSNVLFTHGEADFARSLNIRDDLGETAISIQVPMGSWSEDFYKINEYDSEDMLLVKQNVSRIVLTWL